MKIICTLLYYCWIFRFQSPYCLVIRKPIGNCAWYKKSHQCKACLRPAKRLWAWHSFNFLWIVIKPINGGFRSGIPVSILPEWWLLETRIFIIAHWKLNINIKMILDQYFSFNSIADDGDFRSLSLVGWTLSSWSPYCSVTRKQIVIMQETRNFINVKSVCTLQNSYGFDIH